MGSAGRSGESGDEAGRHGARVARATWIAPSDIDSETRVTLKCTLDDKPGDISKPLEGGTRDDEKVERTVQVRIDPKLTVVVRVADGSSDHLEADGKSVTRLKVRVTNFLGQGWPNGQVTLKTSLGKLKATAMRTDGAGDAYLDLDEDGERDPDEPQEVVLTAGLEGGWAKVEAEINGSTGTKTVLMHRVEVKDFTEPKLLLHNPDSDDADLRDPKIEFQVTSAPDVVKNYQAVITIHTLDSEEPYVTKTLNFISSGATTSRTYSWSQFFYQEGEDPNGRAPSLGEGVYPFQIVVRPTQLKDDELEEHEIMDRAVHASDWKSSLSLTTKYRTGERWTLSYDEDSDQTILSYGFGVYNSASTKAPKAVRVDVYDPDMEKVATLSSTNPPNVNPDDAHEMTYYLRGPVELETAGEYHFVVEVQQADEESEGKDRGKWALERNSSAKLASYVVFGGNTPSIGIGGIKYGQKTDFSDAVSDLGADLRAMSYKGGYTTPRQWWMQDQKGMETGARTVSQIIAQYKGAIPIQNGKWSINQCCGFGR